MMLEACRGILTHNGGSYRVKTIHEDRFYCEVVKSELT